MGLRSLKQKLAAFWSDQRGVTAVIFALAATGLFLTGAVVLEVGNLYRIRNSLQIALDNALLSVGSDPSLDPVHLETEAFKFLDLNIEGTIPPGTAVVTDRYFYFNEDINRIRGWVRVRAGTFFPRLLGLGSVAIQVESVVQRQPPTEVAIVIYEGSSAEFPIPGTGWQTTHMDAQKRAAKQLASILFDQPYTRVGLVPYSNLVNTGLFVTLSHVTIKNPTWSYLPARWTGCVGYRPRNFAKHLDSSTSVRYPGYLVMSPPFPQPDPSAFRPGDRELLSTIPYCNSRIMPLVDKTRRLSMESRINALSGWPEGASVGDYGAFEGDTAIGLTWGWNMLTKDPPLTEARSKERMEEIGGKKIIVLIAYPYSGRFYGPAWDGQTALRADAVMDGAELTRDLCENIKKDGIEIFTVALSGVMEPLFKECATDEDKFFTEDDMYTGTNGSVLDPENIGREIAKRIIVPRLVN